MIIVRRRPKWDEKKQKLQYGPMCELAIIMNACVDGCSTHALWAVSCDGLCRALTVSPCARATKASKIAYIPTKLCATHYVNNAYYTEPESAEKAQEFNNNYFLFFFASVHSFVRSIHSFIHSFVRSRLLFALHVNRIYGRIERELYLPRIKWDMTAYQTAYS